MLTEWKKQLGASHPRWRVAYVNWQGVLTVHAQWIHVWSATYLAASKLPRTQDSQPGRHECMQTQTHILAASIASELCPVTPT